MSEQLPAAPDPESLPEIRTNELLRLDAGASWARIFFHAGDHPTTWDGFRRIALAAPGRFDVFNAGVGGVLYAAVPYPHRCPLAGGGLRPLGPGDASTVATCLAEGCQRLGVLDRPQQRSLVIADLTEPLTLLDVSSDWAARAGAGVHLSSAPKARTSGWATAIAQRWPDLAGVAYISSTRPAGRAVALWAPRAATAVSSSRVRLHRGLTDPLLHPTLAWAADQVGVVI